MKVCFDIGAYHGEDARYYLPQGFEVISVEANPYLIDNLKQQTSIYNNWIIIHAAIVPEDYEKDHITLNINKDHPDWTSTIRQWNEETIEVPTVKLSYLIDKYQSPNLLKMDIEKAELGILSSLKSLNSEYVIIEFSDVNILQELIRLDYKQFRISDQNKRHLWRGNFDNNSTRPWGNDLNIPWTTPEDILNQFNTFEKNNYWADIHAIK